MIETITAEISANTYHSIFIPIKCRAESINNLLHLFSIMPIYHHCRTLEGTAYGAIHANPEFYDPDLAFGYRWLEHEMGFAPVFLSAGDKLEDVYMTGYQDNWRVCMGCNGRGMHNHRTRGEFPSKILFSFSSIEGVFMDYEQWHLV